MPLAELDGLLLAGAIWGLAAAALLAALPLPARLTLRASITPQLARLLAIASSLALAAVGAFGLAGVVPNPIEWWPGLPGDPFRLACDALTSPFLLLLGVLAATSFACVAIPESPGIGDRARLALHAGFVLALASVFTAQHALLLLLAWEGMTLLSAALVASDTGSARARHASFVYLAISHAGTVCLAIGLLQLVSRAGSFALGDIAEMLARAPLGSADVAVWLMSVGFAVKLGLVPLHVWLPLAHPEAPGPVSALLSGVMVQAGFYGLLRFAWQIPGAPPPGFGEVMMIAGVITALKGAMRAALEPDAKRLLAFSTIKHSGLIAMALGLATILARDGRWALAGVALAASLYHAIGHGLAKGLGFLAISEATHAAGSRNLERLGGLAVRMPRTSVAALIATLALSGLPLLSCFAGEWLLFQSLILGYAAGQGSLRFLVPLAGGALALATALASVSLVKLYGIGFLGRPRSEEAARAHPAPAATDATLLALAALGIGWGIASPQAVVALGAPLSSVLGAGFDARMLTGYGGLTLSIPPEAFASISPLAVLTLLAMFVLLAFAWGTARGLRRAVRRAPSWSCGVPLTANNQYSALAFTKPLMLIFAPVLGAGSEMEVLERGLPYFERRVVVGGALRPFAERVLYQPLMRAVLWSSEQARRLQSGQLHRYIAYLLITLVALLLFARH